MSRSGQLRLELVDVHGERLDEKVDIFLRHQTLNEVKAVRRADASKRLLIKHLRAAPQGLYRLQIDAPSYRPVSWLVDIVASGVTDRKIVLPVDPGKVIRLQCPDYDELPHAHPLLEASGNAVNFTGKQGRELYEAVDDVRKAGLLNIITKSHLTRFASHGSVLSYFQELKELRGDRFYAVVSQELRENVKNSVQEDLFTPASDLLHRPPDGYQRAGSFKTPDPVGNLQLSFFAKDAHWVADIDIDDAAGFGHAFQVVGNSISGQPTHPYDIHQVLIHRQAMDPGYRFVLYE
jgi:hypothetical protein